MTNSITSLISALLMETVVPALFDADPCSANILASACASMLLPEELQLEILEFTAVLLRDYGAEKSEDELEERTILEDSHKALEAIQELKEMFNG